MKRSHPVRSAACRSDGSSSFLIALPVMLLSYSLSAQAAETYPQRPVRVVVPFTPGGPNDLMGRVVAQGMSERLNQQFVVDNRPGGGSVIGSEIVAKSTPDGHVLLLASITHAINPGLIGTLPYDSLKGFSPVTILAKSAGILVAHPSLGVQTLKELIALAKAKPSSIVYASSGTGSGGHLEMELLRSIAKIDLLHVPYKGGGTAMTDLLGGRVQIFLTSPVNVIPYIKSGKLRALGVASGTRSPAAPDIPTFAEAGVPGYDSSIWYALLAPARTPDPVVRVLNTEWKAIQQVPAVTQRLSEQGMYTVTTTPGEALSFIAAETARWTKLIREANIRPD